MTDQAKHQPRQVAAYQSLRSVTVDVAATWGAQIGVNLLLPDGTVGTIDQLRQLFGGTSTKINNGSQINTTDDLLQGQFNWYGNVYSKDVAATTYTAGQADNNVILRGTADAGLSITVPSGAFIVGSTLYALQGAAGAVSFVAGSGVTFLPSDSAQTRDKGSLIGLKQTSTDTWEPIGDLAYTFPSTSVHANATNAAAQPVPLQASADKQVLKRSGGTLQWLHQVASDVAFTPTGGITSTDTQAALAELDSKKVDKTELASSGTTPGSTLVGVHPAGGISSTTLDAALNELDTKKATITGTETFAVAAGTADALTAAFSPAITALSDGEQLKVRSAAANATTTPTLAVNALTAHPITKKGNGALVAGDIAGAGHELLLRYVAAGPRFELLNPASSSGGISDAPSDSNLYARKNGSWSVVPADGVPSGGTTGQVLTKNSATSGDYGWAAPAGGGAVLYDRPNPADRNSSIYFQTNNRTILSSSATSGIIRGRIKITSKRYFEAYFATVPANSAGIAAGIATDAHALSASLGFSNPYGWAYWGNSTGARSNGVTAFAGTLASGDVIGFAVDAAAGNIWVSKNGAWLTGDPVAGTSPMWTGVTGNLYAAACPWLGTSSAQVIMCMEPSTWFYDAPSGFSGVA